MADKPAPLTVVLTGAGGGIGSAISRVLAASGHRLVLVGRNGERLEALRRELPEDGDHRVVGADLLDAGQRQRLVETCRDLPDGVDVLINNAGVSTFAMLSATSDETIRAVVDTNLTAPMLLTRDMVPVLTRSARPAIVNIGSAFGHIGHPGFSVYGASKFGLRGFTEALRRELSDGNITVHYLAPRAVDTTMNSAAVNGLNAALGNKADPPEKVATQVLRLLQRRSGSNRFIGWPERLFIKINALFPAIVDNALSKKLATIRQFAAK